MVATSPPAAGGHEIELSSWYPFADAEAAQALFGSIFIGREAMSEVQALYPDLKPSDFSQAAHQAIWTGMLALHHQDQRIDEIILADWLRTHNRLAEALTDLSDLGQYLHCVETSDHAVDYAAIVFHRSLLRQKSLKHEAARIALTNGDEGAYQRILDELADLEQAGLETSEERFQVYDLEQLLERPIASWVWRGIYRAGTRWVIYGPSYSGKSLLAGDLALSYATGLDWQEEKTLQGGVVLYIAAEDATGIAQQAKTWLSYHGKTFADVRGRFHLIEDAVDLLDTTDVARLIKRITDQGIKPDLVILDTFTECFSGDVIDNRQLRLAFQSVGALERAFACGTITIAHSNKAGVSWLGGQYTKANVNAMAEVTQDENGFITLRCEKLRGAPKYESRTYKLQTFADEATLDTLCVLVPSTAPLTPNLLRPREEYVLRSLKDGLRASEWQKAAGMEKQSSTFYDIRDKLVRAGYVTGERGIPYTLTEKGLAYLSDNSTPLQKRSEWSNSSTPLYSSPPIGAGVSGVEEYPTVRYSEQVQMLPSDSQRYGALNGAVPVADGTAARATEPLVFTEEVKKLSNPRLQAITPDTVKQARIQTLLKCLPDHARQWTIARQAADVYVALREPAINNRSGSVLWSDIGQKITAGGKTAGQATDLLEYIRKLVP